MSKCILQYDSIVVSLLELILLTFRSTWVHPGGVLVTRSLVLFVCFVYRCLSSCDFSCGHCVVCSFSIYGVQLPRWNLQTLLSNVCMLCPFSLEMSLWASCNECPFVFVKPSYCLSFFDLRLLITLVYLDTYTILVQCLKMSDMIRVMVFIATFNSISAI